MLNTVQGLPDRSKEGLIAAVLPDVTVTGDLEILQNNICCYSDMSFNFDAKIFINIGDPGLGTYVWAEAISLFSVQRAELIADDETESVFAGAAPPRVAVDDLVDPDGRYIF